MPVCERCDEYYFGNCKCMLYSYRLLGEVSWTPIYGVTPDQIAEKLAQIDYWADPLDPGSFEFCVEVRSPLGDKVKKFKVEAEATVNFTAEEI